MDKIYAYNLMKYDATCEEHKYPIKKIRGYRFDKNIELLEQLFQDDWCIDNEFSIDNINRLVGTYNHLYLMFIKAYYKGVRIMYLVDAFNVYSKHSNVSNEYEKDIELSIKWRNIMKEAYPESTYVEDAKKFLEQERIETIENINFEINSQLESL